MNRSIIAALMAMLLCIAGVQGQVREFPWSIGGGAGALNYYGDLSYKFLDVKQTRPGYTFQVERVLTPGISLRLQYITGSLQGNDRSDYLVRENNAATNEQYARALNFRSDFHDLNLLAVFYLDNGKILSSSATVSPYFMAGFGFGRFRVSGDLLLAGGERYYYWSDQSIRDIDESAVNSDEAVIIEQDGSFETRLSDLDIEGDYSQTKIQVPVGIGLKFRINNHFSIRLESQFTYTFTDYLDDVGDGSVGMYDDAFTAYAADPADAIAGQRGNLKNNLHDTYLFTSASLVYAFGRKKSKFEGLKIQPVVLNQFDAVSTAPEKIEEVSAPDVDIEPALVQEELPETLEAEIIPPAAVVPVSTGTPAVQPPSKYVVYAETAIFEPRYYTKTDTVYIEAPAAAPIQPVVINDTIDTVDTVIIATETKDTIIETDSILTDTIVLQPVDSATIRIESPTGNDSIQSLTLDSVIAIPTIIIATVDSSSADSIAIPTVADTSKPLPADTAGIISPVDTNSIENIGKKETQASGRVDTLLTLPDSTIDIDTTINSMDIPKAADSTEILTPGDTSSIKTDSENETPDSGQVEIIRILPVDVIGIDTTADSMTITPPVQLPDTISGQLDVIPFEHSESSVRTILPEAPSTAEPNQQILDEIAVMATGMARLENMLAKSDSMNKVERSVAQPSNAVEMEAIMNYMDSLQRVNTIYFQKISASGDSNLINANTDAYMISTLEGLRKEMANLKKTVNDPPYQKSLDSLTNAFNRYTASSKTTLPIVTTTSKEQAYVPQDTAGVDKDQGVAVNVYGQESDPGIQDDNKVVATEDDDKTLETILLLNTISGRLDKIEERASTQVTTEPVAVVSPVVTPVAAPPADSVEIPDNTPPDSQAVVSSATYDSISPSVSSDTAVITDPNTQLMDILQEIQKKLDKVSNDYTKLSEEISASKQETVFQPIEATPATPVEVEAKVETPVQPTPFPVARIFFKPNIVQVDPAYFSKIEKAADYLNAHPGTTCQILGFADPSGNAEYNLKLSGQRAGNVRNTLIMQYDINPDRLKVFSMGEEVGFNGNADYSRRVEIKIR